jgi:hypothetical protein
MDGVIKTARRRRFALLVKVDDVTLTQSVECQFNHPDRSVDDTRASGEGGVGVLSAEHGQLDLRRVGKMAEAYLDDLHAATRAATSSASSPATTSVEPRSDRPVSAGLS